MIEAAACISIYTLNEVIVHLWTHALNLGFILLSDFSHLCWCLGLLLK